MDFVARLRQADYHCFSSTVSKHRRSDGSHIIECKKISYSLNFFEKHIIMAHHFHQTNGEAKEMVRIVTCGLPLEKIEAILCRALLFLKIGSAESDSGYHGGVESPALVPHPKAIICGLLEYLEEFSRKQLARYRNWIKKIEDDINEQRDPKYAKLKGLEINSVKLGEASINLGEVRQKLQFLMSSIESLEHIRCLPVDCGPSPPFLNKESTAAEVPDNPEDRLCRQWWYQLREVNIKLLGLRDKCQQHKINIENLQERMKRILSIVSLLLAVRENEWAHQAQQKRQQTADNQLKIIEYQVKMLKQQEFIVARTKRDNTIMKVVAVLTALFLPGTFIATVFSVPVFNWQQDNPIGKHFRTYWYFTAPITTILVVGFSIWFLKMWHDDKEEEKQRAEEELREDVERVSDLDKASLGS